MQLIAVQLRTTSLFIYLEENDITYGRTNTNRSNRFGIRKTNKFFSGIHLKIPHKLTSYEIPVTIYAIKDGEPLQEETFNTHVWTLNIGHWFISKFAEHVSATFYLDEIKNELPLRWKSFSSFPLRTQIVGAVDENTKSYRKEYIKHLGYEYVSTLMLKGAETTIVPKADSKELLFLLTIDGQDKAYLDTSASIGRDGSTTVDTSDGVPLYLPIPSASTIHLKLNNKIYTNELNIKSVKEIRLG